MPGLLCGSNLERARGILDARSRGDVCVVCCWGLVAVHVLSQGDNGGCVTVALVDGIFGPSVALGIGVGVGLRLHFFEEATVPKCNSSGAIDPDFVLTLR